MPLSHPSRLRRSWRALASSVALPAGVWLLTSACGPGVATPMPEPPAFDLSGINRDPLPVTTDLSTSNAGYVLGGANTVPPGATVRITNLDQTSNVASTTASTEGAFQAVVFANDGEELRFEWAQGARRSAPADAIVVKPDPTVMILRIQPAPRFDCLRLTPGFVLDFSSSATATLGVENGCAEPVSLQNPRSRRNIQDFSVEAALPVSVPVGQSASVTVAFERSAAGLREDVLFVDIVQGATAIRYPITLRAE